MSVPHREASLDRDAMVEASGRRFSRVSSNRLKDALSAVAGSSQDGRRNTYNLLHSFGNHSSRSMEDIRHNSKPPMLPDPRSLEASSRGRSAADVFKSEVQRCYASEHEKVVSRQLQTGVSPSKDLHQTSGTWSVSGAA